jgi:UDP-3-O-[3-hydroxymyristoyl] glucosamine N-acyltransferase
MRNLNKSYPLAHLAEHVGGTVVGDPTLIISGLCTLETPLPNQITFIRSASADTVHREIGKLSTTSAVIIPEQLAPTERTPEGPSLILVQDSYASFLNLIPLFFSNVEVAPGIHPSAIIDPSATIAPDARIGACCVIGARTSIGKGFTMYTHARIQEDVVIGDSVTIHSGVSIRNGTQIKDRVTIHDNTVIGADGFGYTPDPKLGLRKVPQLGIVQIESDVEIGANTCIDRGAFGPTIIGQGTKIDNLVQIGHNVTIGRFSILCGNAAKFLPGVVPQCLGKSPVHHQHLSVFADHDVFDQLRRAQSAGVERVRGNLPRPACVLNQCNLRLMRGHRRSGR